MSLSQLRQNELVTIVETVYTTVAPVELNEYANSKEKTEELVDEHFTDEEWDFVQTELQGIVETDPLCSDLSAPEGIFSDDDAVDPEEFDDDLMDPEFETDF